MSILSEETLLESGKLTKVHVNVDPSYPRVFTSYSTGGCARSLGDVYVLLSFISEAFSSINKLKRVHFLVMAFIIIKPCLCLRRFETLFCKLKLGSFKLYSKWLLLSYWPLNVLSLQWKPWHKFFCCFSAGFLKGSTKWAGMDSLLEQNGWLWDPL